MSENMTQDFKPIDLNTENLTFAAIMTNGKKYEIPQYQRDYSWEQEYLEDLWQDIEEMQHLRTQHFMSYLVFLSENNKDFKIVDGQQRITSLILLILACLHHLRRLVANGSDVTENEQRIKIYQETYLGTINPVTLQQSPKLKLNRNNDQHFKRMVENYDEVEKGGLTKSNRLINKAFTFFKNKMAAHTDGKIIANFIETVMNGLVFTVIVVRDSEKAYTLFETLNARGVHLSPPDLLKNYLLSLLAQREGENSTLLDDFEERWGELLTDLGENNFTSFLRSHIGMENKLPHKKQLYRVLKATVSNSDRVMPYLKSIEDGVRIYAGLQNPESDIWQHLKDGSYRDVVADLKILKLFNIKTPYSFLLAAQQKMPANDFLKITQWIAIISIRYNVICGRGAKEQETIYNKIANKIMSATPTLKDIKSDLKAIYPDDDAVKANFKDKTISKSNTKQALFFLQVIELHLSGAPASDDLTIEHILPQKPNDAWQEYFGRQDYESAIERIGNFALFSQTSNPGQENFADKQALLKKTPYKINHKIAEYQTWDIDNLNKYQIFLAKQAAAIWKISDITA